MVKIVYVAHEVGRNPRLNKAKILRVLRQHHTEALIPFAPYLTTLDYLDDSSSEQRALGMAANHELLRRGVADEIGVFGRRISRGMFDEIALCFQEGIPIRAYDDRLTIPLRHALEGLRKGIVFCRYVAARRNLENGNTLFFIDRSRDGSKGSRDLIVAESERSIDLESGRDISLWHPTLLHYDEVVDGWARLAASSYHLPSKDRNQLLSSLYHSLARQYGEGPLGDFPVEAYCESFAA